MYKYLFIIEIYPDDYIDIDRYALALDLNPNANWALEDEAQTKVEENKSLSFARSCASSLPKRKV